MHGKKWKMKKIWVNIKMDILNILWLLFILQPEWDRGVAPTMGSLHRTKCSGEGTPSPWRAHSAHCWYFRIFQFLCGPVPHPFTNPVNVTFQIYSESCACHHIHHCHSGSHLVTSPLCSHTSLLTVDLLHPQSCYPVAHSPQWTLNELTKSSVRPHLSPVQNPDGFHFNQSKRPSSRDSLLGLLWAGPLYLSGLLF